MAHYAKVAQSEPYTPKFFSQIFSIFQKSEKNIVKIFTFISRMRVLIPVLRR